MIPREELKNAVPHGFGKKIAEKAGVSTKAVSNFLNGRTNSHRVQKAVLEVLASEAEVTNELLKKIA